jgi:hypothetical protein
MTQCAQMKSATSAVESTLEGFHSIEAFNSRHHRMLRALSHRSHRLPPRRHRLRCPLRPRHIRRAATTAIEDAVRERGASARLLGLYRRRLHRR